MLLYNYDRITGEYTSVDTAEQDKEASIRLGKYVPFIPAYATDLKPPTAEAGKKAVFEGEKWILKNDYRGKLAINPTTDEIEEIDYIGELKEGYVFYDEYIKTDEYKQKQQALKAAKLSALAMKPIDFINAVETIGIKYSDIIAYCQENSEMDKYLRFSDLIKRGDEYLKDFGEKFKISSERLDKLFKDYGG